MAMERTPNRSRCRRRIRSSRWPSVVRDERGQGMIEFALILPVFLLILVGVIEFGAAYSKVISLRQGVREAGRQASVANFGSTSSCRLAPGTTTQRERQPRETHVHRQGTRSAWAIASDSESSSPTDQLPHARIRRLHPGPRQTTKWGNVIVVCAIYPLNSLTGFRKPFLNGRFARTKAAFRVEKTPTWTAAAPQGDPALDNATDNLGNPPGGRGQPARPEQNWAWCKTG